MNDENWLIQSTVSLTQEPLVMVSYKGQSITMSPSVAILRAIAIINAAAYAEAEGAVFLALIDTKKPKGFGKISEKDMQMGVAVLHLIRDQRKPLPPGVQAIFGFNNQKPFVVLEYGENFEVTLELSDARYHAILLLQASEASRFDAFWYNFANKNLTLSLEEMQAIVQEYKLYKERYAAQSLFDLQ